MNFEKYSSRLFFKKLNSSDYTGYRSEVEEEEWLMKKKDLSSKSDLNNHFILPMWSMLRKYSFTCGVGEISFYPFSSKIILK